MKSTLLLIALIPLAYASIVPGARPARTRALNNRYIIKLKSSASTNTAQRFLESFNSKIGGVEADNNRIIHTYSKVLNGFSGQFSPQFISEFKSSHADSIEYIEEDKIARIMAPAAKTRAGSTQPNPPSWGLTRVSQRKLNLSEPYRYPASAGSSVDAWIVDTGCDPSRSDYGGRAKMMKSFVQNEDAVDLNGHGSHVSGTIGGRLHGIAKNVNIRYVKVLDAEGSGTYADVIAGVDFVAANVKPGKTVMNMSLGGPKSKGLDDSIAAAIKAGVVVVVAAGNESQDACNVSPAGAVGVLAVGATDRNDQLADFSNIGKCVGILAPGVDITSVWIGDQETTTISGTSMASPHVAGVAALLLGSRQFTSVKAVYDELKRLSTSGAIKGVDTNTVNKLLYNNGGN